MTRFKSFHEVEEHDDLPKDAYHEITWWIERELTLDEWIKLDDQMSQILEDMVGDKFMGIAGPIPEIG